MTPHWSFCWISLSCMLSFFTCIASPIERSPGHNTADVPEIFIESGPLPSIWRSSDYPWTATTRRIAADTEVQKSERWTPQQEQHAATVFGSISQLSKRGSGGSAALQPSNRIGPFNLQTRAFQHFGMIVPVAAAAMYLEQFFEVVALRIETGYWANTLPTNYRVFHMWNFELSFYSLHATIPWDFIQAYVLDMVDDIQKGFTGLYHEHLLGVIDGVAAAMTVELRMVREHQPVFTR
ncbi:MAG: hypothetical protein Q9186_001433 [Xanthomendoza sp. 1 TL-2023]